MTEQREFLKLVDNFLKELEFSGDDIVWWPLGRQRQIIIDPRRNFGQPTVAKSGVPATTLARSVKANESIDIVARCMKCNLRKCVMRSSSKTHSRSQREIFFDNNLSPKLAKSLNTLVEPDHQVVHLKDRFAANTPDETWMTALADEDDWVIVLATLASRRTGTKS